MPQYRGINVLQYECDRIEADIASEKEKLDFLDKNQELYSNDVRSSLIETYGAIIESQSLLLSKYKSQLDAFLKSDDRESVSIDYDPLEFLYQEFLAKHLPYIKKRIKIAYDNHYNSILSDSVVLFTRTAKKIALHSLYHHAVGSIIKELLLEKQIHELQSLPRGLNNPESAIQQKYAYFEDRLQHCLEIGKFLKDLHYQ